MSENSTANSMKVRLVITSADVLPQVISNYLCVVPTEKWLRGETVTPKAINVHKEHGWVLCVQGKSDELFAERLIDQLIAMVPVGRVASLCAQYQGLIAVEISVIAYMSLSAPAPSIALSPAQVGFLADCHGSFDVDLYPH